MTLFSRIGALIQINVNFVANFFKPQLKLLASVIPYSGNAKVRYDIIFTLGPFYINKSQFCYPCFCCLQREILG